MPYYLITIKLKDGKKIQGIKVHCNSNIDAMFTFFQHLAEVHYGNQLTEFECVIIAKQSKYYKSWIAGKNKQMKNKFFENSETIEKNYNRKKPPQLPTLQKREEKKFKQSSNFS